MAKKPPGMVVQRSFIKGHSFPIGLYMVFLWYCLFQRQPVKILTKLSPKISLLFVSNGFKKGAEVVMLDYFLSYVSWSDSVTKKIVVSVNNCKIY